MFILFRRAMASAAVAILLAQSPGFAQLAQPADGPAVPPPANAVGPAIQNQQIPDPEVLSEGPIHEAFAEPLALQLREPAVLPQEPPQPVNELPPDQKPEGQNVEWIPGYWEWEQQRNDYVWVSGLWRDVPPGRSWVPGEWLAADDGFQWTPGFWAGEEDVRYLPAPPESLEEGPSSPAPGDDYLWAPGCWQYRSNQYVWQAGFWYQSNPDWVWVPSHYSYASRGCVYVNGYWDYPLAYRGLLYAPVYWRGGYRPYYGSYLYRPVSLINTGLLIANLLVDRNYGHYYYGYGRGGNVPPWLYTWGRGYDRWGGRYNKNHRHYDPLWAYHKQQHQGGGDHRNWDARGGRGRRGDGQFDGDRRDRFSSDQLVVNSSKLDRNQRQSLKLNQLSDGDQQRNRQRAEQYRNTNREELIASGEFRNRNGERGNRQTREQGQGGTDRRSAQTSGQRDQLRQGRGAEGNASARVGRGENAGSAQAETNVTRERRDNGRSQAEARVRSDQQRTRGQQNVESRTQSNQSVQRTQSNRAARPATEGSQQLRREGSRLEGNTNARTRGPSGATPGRVTGEVRNPTQFSQRGRQFPGSRGTSPQVTQQGRPYQGNRGNSQSGGYQALRPQTQQLRSYSSRSANIQSYNRSSQRSVSPRSYSGPSRQASPARQMQRSAPQRSGGNAYRGRSGGGGGQRASGGGGNRGGGGGGGRGRR